MRLDTGDISLPPFPTEHLHLPDEELAEQFWAWWVVFQLEQVGMSPWHSTPEILDPLIENIRLASLRLDTEKEELAGLEKILRLLATGVPENCLRAARMIRDYFRSRASRAAAIDEAKTGRRRQRTIARKPRPDALGSLILELVRNNPTITVPELIAELRKQEHRGVIETVNEEEEVIEWTNRKRQAEETPFSGLKDRMNRAREILRSR